MVEIRPYTDASASTRSQLSEVFSLAAEGSPGGGLWGDAVSEAAVYLDPYVELEPSSLFLAAKGDHLVGYLAGCVDSSAFPREDARIDAAIRQHRLFQRRSTRPFFLRAVRDGIVDRLSRRPAVTEFDDPRWPSHLHIDVLPIARGTGAADELMAAWSARLAASGSPGCHLQTQVENARARRFFARHGFVDQGIPVPIPGVRFEKARVYQQTMVRTT